MVLHADQSLVLIAVVVLQNGFVEDHIQSWSGLDVGGVGAKEGTVGDGNQLPGRSEIGYGAGMGCVEAEACSLGEEDPGVASVVGFHHQTVFFNYIAAIAVIAADHGFPEGEGSVRREGEGRLIEDVGLREGKGAAHNLRGTVGARSLFQTIEVADQIFVLPQNRKAELAVGLLEQNVAQLLLLAVPCTGGGLAELFGMEVHPEEMVKILFCQLHGDQLTHVPADVPAGAGFQRHQVHRPFDDVGGGVDGGAGDGVLAVLIEGLCHMELHVLYVQTGGNIGGLVESVQTHHQVVVGVFHQAAVEEQGEFHGVFLLLKLYAAVIVPAVIVDTAAEPHLVQDPLDVDKAGEKDGSVFRHMVAEAEVEAELILHGYHLGQIQEGGACFIEGQLALIKAVALGGEAGLGEPMGVEHDIQLPLDGFRDGEAILPEHGVDGLLHRGGFDRRAFPDGIGQEAHCQGDTQDRRKEQHPKAGLFVVQDRPDAVFDTPLAEGQGAQGDGAVGHGASDQGVGILHDLRSAQLFDDLFIAGQLDVPAQEHIGQPQQGIEPVDG